MEEKRKKISLATYVVSLIIMLAIIVGLVFVIVRGDNNKDVTENVIENVSGEEKIDVDEYILLHKGTEIKKEVGVQHIGYGFMEFTKENKEKYNIEYYNYEKNEEKGKTQGIFGEDQFVENVSDFVSEEEKTMQEEIGRLKAQLRIKDLEKQYLDLKSQLDN